MSFDQGLVLFYCDIQIHTETQVRLDRGGEVGGVWTASYSTIRLPGGSQSLFHPNRITCHRLGCLGGISACDTTRS